MKHENEKEAQAPYVDDTERYKEYLLTSPTSAEATEQLRLLVAENRRKFPGIWGATAELLALENAIRFFRAVLKEAEANDV